jgi:predicted anti-sigma-YlaC factor YlaD
MTRSVSCNEFLHRYSDYRDGVVQGRDRLRLEGHLAVCRQCQEYDASVARGVLVLQNSGEIEPSRTLSRQLRERIAAGRRRTSPLFPLFPAYAGVLAGLLLIGSVGMMLVDRHEESVRVTAVDSPAADPVPVSEPVLVRPATLTVPDTSLRVQAFGADWHAPGPDEEPYIMKPALTR